MIKDLKRFFIAGKFHENEFSPDIVKELNFLTAFAS